MDGSRTLFVKTFDVRENFHPFRFIVWSKKSRGVETDPKDNFGVDSKKSYSAYFFLIG